MNLKKILISFLLILPSLFISAQNQISGNIKDELTKENLIGVSIYISDLKTGTSSDQNGNFVIKNIKSGSYLLEISFLGYKSIIRKLNLENDTTINFVLSEAVNELSEVIVTGVSRSTELKLNPIIAKTIDQNILNQSASTNLIDGLKIIPGVNQITTGASISKPIIRGLGYNRVITLNNGIKQEGQQWGDEHGIEIDEYSVERVEIVKGPGSLMYGSDGIAGVLNFLAPKPPFIGEMKTQLITNYQSNNNLIGWSLSNAGNKKGFQWLGRLSNKWAGNYSNHFDGKVYNSGFKELDGSLFFGINENWGHSHLTISSYNNTLNLIEGERDSSGKFSFIDANGLSKTANDNDLKGYKTGFPYQEINHFRITSNTYYILNKGTIHADLAYQNNVRKEFGDPTAPKDIGLYFNLNTLNYNIKYNVERIKGWETSIGIGGMQQSNVNKGLDYLIPEYHLFDVGAFVFSQKTFSKFTVAAGIRIDDRMVNSKELYLDSLNRPISNPDMNSSLKFSPFSKNYSGVSGSIGMSYQLNKESTIKFNLSRGFRSPNIAELASNGKHEGTFRYEIGHVNLKSEISHQIDLAYYLNYDHVTFEFSPFMNFIHNYIYTEKLISTNGGDSIPDKNDPASAFRFTSGNARLFGGELYFDIHPHPLDWLHLESSFSYVQATQNNKPDSLKYLPFIPAPKYSGELKAQFRKLGKVFSNAYVKFGIDHYFKQDKYFVAYRTETATSSYTLLNAGLGANIKAMQRKDVLSLFLSVENITNLAYQNHLSRLKYAPENIVTGRIGVFNMGRNVSLKLIMNF